MFRLINFMINLQFLDNIWSKDKISNCYTEKTKIVIYEAQNRVCINLEHSNNDACSKLPKGVNVTVEFDNSYKENIIPASDFDLVPNTIFVGFDYLTTKEICIVLEAKKADGTTVSLQDIQARLFESQYAQVLIESMTKRIIQPLNQIERFKIDYFLCLIDAKVDTINDFYSKTIYHKQKGCFMAADSDECGVKQLYDTNKLLRAKFDVHYTDGVSAKFVWTPSSSHDEAEVSYIQAVNIKGDLIPDKFYLQFCFLAKPGQNFLTNIQRVPIDFCLLTVEVAQGDVTEKMTAQSNKYVAPDFVGATNMVTLRYLGNAMQIVLESSDRAANFNSLLKQQYEQGILDKKVVLHLTVIPPDYQNFGDFFFHFETTVEQFTFDDSVIYQFLCSEQKSGLEMCVSQLSALKELPESAWEAFVTFNWKRGGAAEIFASAQVGKVSDSCFSAAEVEVRAGGVFVLLTANALSKYCSMNEKREYEVQFQVADQSGSWKMVHSEKQILDRNSLVIQLSRFQNDLQTLKQSSSLRFAVVFGGIAYDDAIVNGIFQKDYTNFVKNSAIFVSVAVVIIIIVVVMAFVLECKKKKALDQKVVAQKIARPLEVHNKDAQFDL